MKLYDFQKEVLKQVKDKNKCAFYLDMGLGKTFVGSEKMKSLKGKVNLIICQKSKVQDWIDHFETHYSVLVYDLTKKKSLNDFVIETLFQKKIVVGIINYDLIWRRDDLKKIRLDTLMLDESSLIQNDTTKRTKFIMRMHYNNLIFLSGTPTGGKYEKLYTQLKMLGMSRNKTQFWNDFVEWHFENFGQSMPFKVVDGYKNVNQLKKEMKKLGCVFMKTEEVIELPDRRFVIEPVLRSREYVIFLKHRIVKFKHKNELIEFVGDVSLKYLLYLRMLASAAFNKMKMQTILDYIESTEERIIIFYNFKAERDELVRRIKRPISEISGDKKDLEAYENESDSITLVQYQAGAMGINLQKAAITIYASPTLSSELYEQSKKRTHRIGQIKSCLYILPTCGIEHHIYDVLNQRKDYTNALFEKHIENKRI